MKIMVIRSIQIDNDIEKAGGERAASDDEMPSDDDEANNQFEYEQWKVRELKRIRREKNEREERIRE
jgi:microfibrillar-associated protein 1